MGAPSAEAIEANDRGVDLADARQYARAIPFYEQALPLAPDWHAPHLNLGIACKHTGDWRRSLSGCLRAYELDPEKSGNGALWNVGVAATALGDWDRARWAWTKIGIKLAPGEGPIELNLGMTPIRVNCADRPEVVWCHRIDPARARIESIPTPQSGRRFHDLVLHDGEPRGKRELDGRQVSVFDELAVLERSPFQTWTVDVVAPSPLELEALFEAVADGSSAALEDWTSSLELICKQCSEGVPHQHAPVPQAWEAARRIAIATTDDVVFRWITSWAKGPGRSAGVPVRVTAE